MTNIFDSKLNRFRRCQIKLYGSNTILNSDYLRIKRPIFYREKPNKIYGVDPYYISNFMIDVPKVAIMLHLFSSMVYFKIGLTFTVSQFFYFYLTLLLISENAPSFGYFTFSFFDSKENASALVPLIILPFVVFGGQFSNSANYQI